MTGIRPLDGPRDLPRLREHLLHSWRQDGPLARAVEIQRGLMRAERHPAALADDPAGSLPEDHWHRKVLADAALWWVDADMCELLQAAESGLPADTLLDDALVPQPHGLVVFERSLASLDAKTGERAMMVDAIAWGGVRIIDKTLGPRWALGIASYQRMNLDDGLTADEMEHAANSGALAEITTRVNAPVGVSVVAHGDIWAPLGRSDWIEGSRLNSDTLAGTRFLDRERDLGGSLGALTLDEQTAIRASFNASAIEDRRRLATLWLLAVQPGIAETVLDHGDRAIRRREQRAGREPQPVRIIMLPRRRRAAGTSEPTGRHLRVRTLVNGFWRNQPYGKGRAYRRPTWIAPFWRGPEDGPISTAQTVRVVRPLTDDELEGE